MSNFRSSRNLMGRFSTTYEVNSIGGGITADLQNPVGQSVLWWVFDPETTKVDPTYDVGGYWNRGRVWFTPFEIPVVLATIEQGMGGHTERGLYTIDTLRLVINTPEITPYLPNIAYDPDTHLLDRIEYRGGLFQPVNIYPKGHVQHDMVVIQVEAEQIKDDESVNDTQFNGSKESPSGFGPAFNPGDFHGREYAQGMRTDLPLDDEDLRTVEQVEDLPRWGDHVIYTHEDLYETRE